MEGDFHISTSFEANSQVLTLCAIPKVVENTQHHPGTLQGEAQFGKNVTPNPKRMRDMGITNAGQLGEQFRTLLGEVKKQLADATVEMNGAMTELKDTTNQAVGMVKQVKTETADLKAALGLNSNNPPA